MAWGTWLGIDEESRAAAHAKKEQEREAKHTRALEELRKLFDNEEGRICGRQLAEGGEFGRDGAPEELVSDAYLRRWLAAREWEPVVAHKLLLEHGAWRARTSPRGYVEEEKVKGPLADEKAFLQGVDHEGRAVVIVRVANHLTARRDIREMRLFSAYILDALVTLCDAQRNPQRRVVAFFDMTGGCMANMDVAGMKTILGLLSTHYVERLSSFYFYNPPTIFWGLWAASKHLLPEVTRQKIHMIDPKDLHELREGIPSDVLPKEYGGEAELRPIEQAARHFRLPPYDGRDLAASGNLNADVAAAAVALGAARLGGGSEGGESVDARLEVAEEGAGGKAAAVDAAAAAAPVAVTAA
ncbi:MAG: CRAL-TRIO domain-containing protein [Monoraphidium minutum]|nr:MAG: CRAL-TRIO domain-containing protein [Monoraphidium minutum]